MKVGPKVAADIEELTSVPYHCKSSLLERGNAALQVKLQDISALLGSRGPATTTEPSNTCRPSCIIILTLGFASADSKAAKDVTVTSFPVSAGIGGFRGGRLAVGAAAHGAVPKHP
jgi:hypothetical protein